MDLPSDRDKKGASGAFGTLSRFAVKEGLLNLDLNFFLFGLFRLRPPSLSSFLLLRSLRNFCRVEKSLKDRMEAEKSGRNVEDLQSV